MVSLLKWLFIFWKIRGDAHVRQALAALRTLSWSQRASLIAGLARDPRIPSRARLAPLLLAAYIASPLDLIPDFVPVLGQLDDIALMNLMFRFVQRSLPAGVLEEHLRRVTGLASS